MDPLEAVILYLTFFLFFLVIRAWIFDAQFLLDGEEPLYWETEHSKLPTRFLAS